MCVCVCVCVPWSIYCDDVKSTHTHPYIWIYIYPSLYICTHHLPSSSAPETRTVDDHRRSEERGDVFRRCESQHDVQVRNESCALLRGELDLFGSALPRLLEMQHDHVIVFCTDAGEFIREAPAVGYREIIRVERPNTRWRHAHNPPVSPFPTELHAQVPAHVLLHRSRPLPLLLPLLLLQCTSSSPHVTTCISRSLLLSIDDAHSPFRTCCYHSPSSSILMCITPTTIAPATAPHHRHSSLSKWTTPSSRWTRERRTNVCVYLYVMCVYIDDGMDTMHDERDAIGYVCMYVCVCVYVCV